MPRKPRTKITKEGNLLFLTTRKTKPWQKDKVRSLRRGKVRDWSNIGGSFSWWRPLKIKRK